MIQRPKTEPHESDATNILLLRLKLALISLKDPKNGIGKLFKSQIASRAFSIDDFGFLYNFIRGAGVCGLEFLLQFLCSGF